MCVCTYLYISIYLWMLRGGPEEKWNSNVTHKLGVVVYCATKDYELILIWPRYSSELCDISWRFPTLQFASTLVIFSMADKNEKEWSKGLFPSEENCSWECCNVSRNFTEEVLGKTQVRYTSFKCREITFVSNIEI